MRGNWHQVCWLRWLPAQGNRTRLLAEMITKDNSLTSNPEVCSIIQLQFHAVTRFVLTLSLVLLADSVALVYGSLINAKPTVTMYFVPFLRL